jgi:hypothetical protein
MPTRDAPAITLNGAPRSKIGGFGVFAGVIGANDMTWPINLVTPDFDLFPFILLYPLT